MHRDEDFQYLFFTEPQVNIKSEHLGTVGHYTPLEGIPSHDKPSREVNLVNMGYNTSPNMSTECTIPQYPHSPELDP